ncbi:response regulator transcription factor [Mollicutes bacterium LVI A0039]|nr:response regulator transcription factor [Mollicutes bacterium LVI A0039]
MKILIVEDNFEIANAYREELKKHNMISDIAMNYEQGLKKINSNQYDVALLDINLPDKSGIELLNTVRMNQVPIGIIMVTARTEEQLIVSSLDDGADDYLQKPVRYNELISRVKAVHRRMQSRNTSNLSLESIEIDYSKNIVMVDNQILKMTSKEYLIMTKLCEHYPGYCTTEQLNGAISDEYEISSASIRVHIYNLKKKLQDHQITINNSKNLGYILCFQQ